MFLYAKVVLDNLLSQDSPADFKEEMSTDNFPDGLDAAYAFLFICGTKLDINVTSDKAQC